MACSVSRALVPASNCWRIFCRSASACGPSTDRGVGDSCMSLEGGIPESKPGRAAMVTFRHLAVRFPAGRRLPNGLGRIFAALFVANPDGFVHPRQEYLTVNNISCLGGLQNGVDYTVYQHVRQNHLELDLRQEIHGVFAPAVHFGVALLAAVAAD